MIVIKKVTDRVKTEIDWSVFISFGRKFIPKFCEFFLAIRHACKTTNVPIKPAPKGGAK